MRTRVPLLAFLLCLLPLAALAHAGVEKYVHGMRLVHASPRGGYRLCAPVRGRGFCVLGSGPCEGVLLGYSPQGCAERALANPQFLSFLNGYVEADAWQHSPRVLPAGVKRVVEPLLTDSWNQPAPYNVCTPMIGGQHCQVGCVALAMAQVMHYWRWPARGTGSHTYVDSLGCGQVLEADFAHDYRWDVMRDIYEGEADSADASLLETGRLLRDCGVAVKMRYGLEASAARSVRQAMALYQWMGYDEGMQVYFRDFFSRAEWEGMLLEELSAGRPVLFSAQSSTLSHALVCDGYDEDGLFHMNFGLGGDADGYYYLPHLTPQQPDWYDPASAEGGLNLLQYMTVGVQPATHSPVVRHSLGLASVEPVDAASARDGRVSVCTAHLANVGWNEFASDAAHLVLLSGDSVVCALTGFPHPFVLEELTDSTYTDTLVFAVPRTVDEGLYRVTAAVREPRGEWTLARASMGTPPHVLLRVTQDSLLLRSDTARQACLRLLACEFPDSVRTNQRPPFSLSLRNDGSSEYCGRLSVLMREVADSTRFHALQYQGVWLAPGEEVTFTFRRTPVHLPAGDYELCLAYDTNLFTDSLVWLTPYPIERVRVHPYIPSGVEQVDADGDAAAVRYGIDGLPWSKGQRGIAVERMKGKNRKIVTR